MKPDNWVVISINGDDPHYKLLMGWSGGYAQGSLWQMNSGITRCEETETGYDFYGSSGSCYSCGKNFYGLRMNNAGVWDNLQNTYGDKVKLLAEDANWTEIDWII